MATPNQMPKRPNELRQQLLAGLISTSKYTREKKTIVKDKDGKDQINVEKTTEFALRFPLAQNVSEQNVEALAKRWI